MSFLRWFQSLSGRPAAVPPPSVLPPGTQPPIGLVAGRGVYPLEFCKAARQAGVARIVVAAMHQETDPSITALADHVDWVYVGQIARTIRVLRDQGVERVVFAGQVKPSRLFTGFRPDFKALRLLWGLKERNAHSLFGAIVRAFEDGGLRVLPATTHMESCLAAEGVLGRVHPNRTQMAAVNFGLRIAREISRLDIGQTVVVKKGTVLAVEGFEGTDKAIRRGGELGYGGVTVVKVAKPGHDLRFDVPCIGRNTVDSLIAAKAKTLAVHAGMTLFLERDAVLSACDQAGIAVIGVKPEGD